MYANVLAFAAGVVLLQQLPSLPPAGAYGLLAAVLAILAAAGGRLATTRPRAARALLALASLLAGFGWAAGRAELRLADELAMELEGRDLEVVGVVAALPERRPGVTSFEFDVDPADQRVPGRLRLDWHAPRSGRGEPPPRLEPGQRWALSVRLKRPHGLLNPHLGDATGRLLEDGIRATGYVREQAGNRLLADRAGGAGVALERFRQRLRDRFEEDLAGRPWRGMLIALTLGDQAAVPEDHWALFRATGIVHLAVISGLHVTLVAGLAGLCGGALWRRSRLALRLPAQKFAVLAALAAGWGYALLAGLGIPVQRSALMLSVVALCLLLDRLVPRSRALALALLAVLLFDPWAVLAAGFWLSFLAVAILLSQAERGAPGRWSAIRLALRAQWAINLGMIAALVIFFQQFSLIAPVANLLAIPVVGLGVLPLCLGYVVAPLPALVQLAEHVVGWLMVPVAWLGAVSHAIWVQAAPPAWLSALGLLACAWLVLPAGTPGRAGAALGLMSVLLYVPPRPAPGDFRVVVLDVGQGLAVHVQTAAHDLMFDSGPAWPAGDAGARVVLPYLRAEGVARLDLLVVSHADSDHAGGSAAIIQGIEVARKVSHRGADTSRFGSGPWGDCGDAGEWEWDRVRFRWLNPAPGDSGPPARDDNNRSCVLRVEGRGGSALLTADIEASTERRLTEALGGGLATDLVLAPHHGSRSSSSPDFVASSRARAVVFPVGYRSRFGHPHPEVWARWAATGALGYRSDSQGAVSVRFDADGMRVRTERERRERYWHGR